MASAAPFITPTCGDMRVQTVVTHFPYDCTFMSALHLAWITRHSLNSVLFTSLDSVPCPLDNRFLTLEITVCWGVGGRGVGVTFHLLCSDRPAQRWYSRKDRNTNLHVEVGMVVRTWIANACERVSDDN